MHRICELIEDRKGKLSPHKLIFLLSALIFLIGWMFICIYTQTLPEMNNSLSIFIGVVGGTQLGSSFIANKSDLNKVNNPPVSS